MTLNSLGVLYSKQHRDADAERILADLVERAERNLGVEDELTLGADSVVCADLALSSDLFESLLSEPHATIASEQRQPPRKLVVRFVMSSPSGKNASSH